MKYRLVCWFLLAASAACFGIDRNAFTFTHYSLDVRVEPEQQRLAVRGRITLRNDSTQAQKNAVLQISSSLDWRSIQVDKKPVQFVSQPYASDIDHTGAVSEAIVSLPVAVPPKGTVDLDVGYEGVIPLDATRLKRIGVPEEIAQHSDWDQISPAFTAVRGVGYVAWYPVAMEAANLSEGNSAFEIVGGWKNREQAAGMEVNLCLVSEEQSITVLMNDGEPAMLRDKTTGCPQHSFSPMNITVPAFVLAPYERLEAPGLSILYLGRDRGSATEYSQAASRVLPLVADWFGGPKQIERVAELADASATPFETGSVMLTPFSKDPKLAELSVVHQLAHSAFISSHPWISEGIAHFAQALWREKEDGRQAALEFVGLHRSALATIEERAASDPQPLVSSAEEEIFRTKALFVWWMLRDMVGQGALKNALAAYRAEQDVRPDYLQSILQAQTKRDLGWFFDDWVYHDRGLPDFRVLAVYPTKTERGIYLVTVTIENSGNAGAEVPFTVRFAEGEMSQRLVVKAKSQATLRVETPAMPTEVVVNDGSVPESNLANNFFKAK